MAQVDLAARAACPACRRRIAATVAVNEFVFKQPVRVGDILSLFANVSHINTSITVQVEVYAEPFGRPVHQVTEASLTYVAIDDAGRPAKSTRILIFTRQHLPSKVLVLAAPGLWAATCVLAQLQCRTVPTPPPQRATLQMLPMLECAGSERA
jgi:hypothetical protein